MDIWVSLQGIVDHWKVQSKSLQHFSCGRPQSYPWLKNKCEHFTASHLTHSFLCFWLEQHTWHELGWLAPSLSSNHGCCWYLKDNRQGKRGFLFSLMVIHLLVCLVLKRTKAGWYFFPLTACPFSSCMDDPRVRARIKGGLLVKGHTMNLNESFSHSCLTFLYMFNGTKAFIFFLINTFLYRHKEWKCFL